jgi:hypothetical protein
MTRSLKIIGASRIMIHQDVLIWILVLEVRNRSLHKITFLCVLIVIDLYDNTGDGTDNV